MIYSLKKILDFLVTLFLISLFVFIMLLVIPGDPAQIALGINAPAEQVQLLREELGLNQPVWQQFFHWLRNALTGNLGTSLQYRIPVSQLILERLPVTLTLGGLSFIFIFITSLPLALLASRKPGKALDFFISLLNQTFLALPPFVVALLLTLLLGILFKPFSPISYVPWQQNKLHFLQSLLIPAIAIALPKISFVQKFWRENIIQEKKQDYVLYARSQGLPPGQILFKEILPNTFISILTVFALVLSEILGGSLIIEKVFNLPGLGRLLLDAVSSRDLPLIQGLVVYLASLVIFIRLIAQVWQKQIDPRFRNRHPH